LQLLKCLIISFIICYVASSFVWLIWLSIHSPWYYANARLQDHVNTVVLNILPMSLLPFASSVVTKNVFRKTLHSPEIFLISWFISAFEVIGFFYLLVLKSDPRAHVPPPYPPFEFEILSLFIPTVCTIAYVMFKKRKEN
jgi:hypothetical protein